MKINKYYLAAVVIILAIGSATRLFAQSHPLVDLVKNNKGFRNVMTFEIQRMSLPATYQNASVPTDLSALQEETTYRTGDTDAALLTVSPEIREAVRDVVVLMANDFAESKIEFGTLERVFGPKTARQLISIKTTQAEIANASERLNLNHGGDMDAFAQNLAKLFDNHYSARDAAIYPPSMVRQASTAQSPEGFQRLTQLRQAWRPALRAERIVALPQLYVDNLHVSNGRMAAPTFGIVTFVLTILTFISKANAAEGPVSNLSNDFFISHLLLALTLMGGAIGMAVGKSFNPQREDSLRRIVKFGGIGAGVGAQAALLGLAIHLGNTSSWLPIHIVMPVLTFLVPFLFGTAVGKLLEIEENYNLRWTVPRHITAGVVLGAIAGLLALGAYFFPPVFLLIVPTLILGSYVINKAGLRGFIGPIAVIALVRFYFLTNSLHFHDIYNFLSFF